MSARPVEERFWEKVNRPSVFECWPWMAGSCGTDDEHQYGRFSINNRNTGAHRFALSLFLEDNIPEDMTVDHLCRNTLCCNPFHLEVTTVVENIRRGLPFRTIDYSALGAKSHKNKKDKDSCIHGHDLWGPNVRFRTNGARECKSCKFIRNTNKRNNGRHLEPIKALI